jgi:hypothetical protein
LKVVLLQLENEQMLFYVEGEEKDWLARSDAERGSGFFAYAENQYDRMQRMLTESKGAVGQRMKSVWQWLQQKIDPQEALLRSLRRAATIDLLYPSDMSEREALDQWSRFLAAKDKHHIFRVILNTSISPFTILLTPLPGPNIIGYWFVYRAFCHTLALMGVRRARNSLSSIRLISEPLLNGRLQVADEAGLEHLSKELGLNGLGRYLIRSAKFTVAGNGGGLAEESSHT